MTSCPKMRPGPPAPILAILLSAALVSCGGGAPDETTRDSAPGTGESQVDHADGDSDGERHVDMLEDRPIRGTIRLATPQSLRTFNPVSADTIENRFIDRFLSLKLLEVHPEEVEPVPWLAASFPELSDDGRTQDWTLREGARWSDGRPVTPQDVVSTWALMRDEAVAKKYGTASKLAAIAPLESIEATGERTFRVTLSSGGVMSWARFGLDFPIMPAPTGDATALDLANLESVPGNGPYTVSSKSPEAIALERKSDWWGDAHSMFKNRYRAKRFIHKRYEDAATRLRAFLAGELDLIQITPDKLAELDGRKGIETASYYLSQWGYIGWNCEDPVLSDVRVRTALSHLMQRSAMIERYFHGLSYPVTGPFFVRSIFNDANIEPHRFSVTTAKELLAEAGWKDHDGDGDLDREGADLAITIKMGTAMDGFLGGPMAQFRETLSQVGIACTIEKLDIGAVFAAARKGEFQGYVAAWPVDPVLPDMYDAYHSSQVEGGNNWQRYRNDEMDEALETFRSTLDDARRVRSARKVHELLHRDQPMMFLFNIAACIAWQERLEGVHAYPLGFREWDFWSARD